VGLIISVFSPLFGREIDANQEILTTVGAAEALLLSIMAFINPGDQVIMLEPYFDFYPAQVKMAGTTFQANAVDWALANAC
jgi:aspartate/methionine/tyrosine aminotransferase